MVCGQGNGRLTFFFSLGERGTGVTVLRVSGELDLHSAPRFQEALEGAVAAAERAEGPASKVLIADLSEAAFMDSVGISDAIDDALG